MSDKVCIADIAALQRVCDQMRADMDSGWGGLSDIAVRSLAGIIEAAIGAPIDMPTRSLGADFAQKHYPGSPSQRLAFNHGVKWALEHCVSSQPISDRFPPKPLPSPLKE